jgi:hypothetical protein
VKSFLAVARLEMFERRFVLVAGAAIALVPWLLPLVPGLTRQPESDLRTISSFLIGFAFALCLGLLLGTQLFTPDVASRRLGFHLARPISAVSLFAGRLAGTWLVLSLASFAVLIPVVISAGRSPGFRSELPFVLFLPLSLLSLLVGNAWGVALRSRSPWLAIDAVLFPTLALVVWTASRRLSAAGAETLLDVLFTGLVVAALLALFAAGLAQIALGRVDLLRAHGALSLTLWAVLLPVAGAYEAASRWALSPDPEDLRTLDVQAVASAGPWVAVSGVAARRLGMRTGFLLDTDSGRFHRIGRGFNVAFSADGLSAIYQPGAVSRQSTREELVVVRLGGERPVARPSGIAASSATSPLLALSPDGSRAAVLDRGTLSVYELGAKRLVAAAKVSADSERHRLVFRTPDHVLLTPHRFTRRGSDGSGTASLPLYDLDLATKSFVKTADVAATPPASFQRSLDAMRMLVSERTPRRVSLVDVQGGAARSVCVFEGFFSGVLLDAGRIALFRWGHDGSSLTLASSDCTSRPEIPLPPARYLTVPGQPEQGTLAVAALSGAVGRAETFVLLVDLSSGAVRRLEGLSPVVWFSGEGAQRPGGVGSRLFMNGDGALVALDPKTGATRTILRGGATD